MRSIRKTRPVTSILILYGWCGRGTVFHVSWTAIREYLVYLVLSRLRRQRQTHSGLEWVSANSLGLLARHGVNCCLCLWYANVSFFFFFPFFLGRRLAQGVGKGVYLLWLWNKPPYVKASAATLASVLFTVTLSHLIQMMLIASKIVLWWSDSGCPLAALHLCLKGEICDSEFIFCSHRFPNC